jgi:pimeloyl-ACP methyl ester carboxylesterase
MRASHEIMANGLRIHYVRTGGYPPLPVLTHGATDSGACWGRVAAALAIRYDVIAADTRGHGQTDAPDGDDSRAEMAADLASVLGALVLDRPIVAGHSMDAATVLTMIATHPEIACATVLGDPGSRLEGGDGARMVARCARMRDEHAQRQAMSHAEVVVAGKAANPLWHDDDFDAWAEAKQRISPQFLAPTNVPPTPDWRSQLPHVIGPVLLIRADSAPLGNSAVTAESATVAQRLCPTLEVAHVPGAGHNVRREQFSASMVAVVPFLARHA